MKKGVAEVRILFSIDRDVVKDWAWQFQDYLSFEANPPKGTPRQFTFDDLLVFSYIREHWEENPDVESIMAGLNGGAHHEDRYEEFLLIDAPIFQEPPDGLDETWRHGSLIGGMVEGAVDGFALAESFRLAGDILVDSVSATTEAYEIVRPAIFSYRHALELYLKAVLPDADVLNSSGKPGHELKGLLDKLRLRLKNEHNADIPKWFGDVILDFHEFDPRSTALRYAEGENQDKGELWIDLPRTKDRLDQVARAFERIREAIRRSQN